LKISVSRRVTFIDRSPLRSSFLGPRNEGFNRCPSPPGFPQCPTVRELRGALILLAPSTEMSCMTIYLADLLGRDGRAFHLVPSTDHLAVARHWRKAIYSRKATVGRGLDNPCSMPMHKWAGLYDHGSCAVRFHRSNLPLQLAELAQRS